jgi:hypothetical protein
MVKELKVSYCDWFVITGPDLYVQICRLLLFRVSKILFGHCHNNALIRRISCLRRFRLIVTRQKRVKKETFYHYNKCWQTSGPGIIKSTPSGPRRYRPVIVVGRSKASFCEVLDKISTISLHLNMSNCSKFTNYGPPNLIRWRCLNFICCLPANDDTGYRIRILSR